MNTYTESGAVPQSGRVVAPVALVALVLANGAAASAAQPASAHAGGEGVRSGHCVLASLSALLSDRELFTAAWTTKAELECELKGTGARVSLGEQPVGDEEGDSSRIVVSVKFSPDDVAAEAIVDRYVSDVWAYQSERVREFLLVSSEFI